MTPSDQPERKSLAQYAAEAREGGGLVCPKCGATQFAVRNTIRIDGAIRRYRKCRHCGRILRTTER